MSHNDEEATMRRPSGSSIRRSGVALAALVTVAGIGAAVGSGAVARPATAAAAPVAPAAGQGKPDEQVLRGRALLLNHGCADCHGGGSSNPAGDGYLAGMRTPQQEFLIGPCATQPGATPCFHTRPRNLTPDNTTGLGRFSERQIFNALRYGLRPGETPDVEITSTTPGEGNFPRDPKYLAPPMPWPAFRHMSDQELRDIAAYLKRGVKPVRNRVPDSEGPPDFWASEYTPDKIGTYPAPAFPTANEQLPVVAGRPDSTGQRDR
jgi:mono/diheme cytochrome c family protein